MPVPGAFGRSVPFPLRGAGAPSGGGGEGGQAQRRSLPAAATAVLCGWRFPIRGVVAGTMGAAALPSR
jgi:hypothetical protein